GGRQPLRDATMATWIKGHVPPGGDPLLHWRLVEMADFLPEDDGSRWWSAQLDLRNTTLEQCQNRLKERAAVRPEASFHLPVFEQQQATLLQERQLATIYANREFFELVHEQGNPQELGIERIVLGRILPKGQRDVGTAFG